MATQTVTLGAQTSVEDDRTMEHVLALRKLLGKYCQGPYCKSVDELALILRIGGDMQEFAFEGCGRLRRNRKSRYITVDLGFPSRHWKSASNQHIREFLADSVHRGIVCCLNRMEKDRESIDSARLLSDFAAVRAAFLSESQ